MAKKTLLAVIIALTCVSLFPLPVLADSATLTIIQPDASEGVSIISAEYSYQEGYKFPLVIFYENPDRQISSFRVTATDGDGVSTVTTVDHTQLVYFAAQPDAIYYPLTMTAGGIVVDNITAERLYPVTIPTSVANGNVQVLGKWRWTDGPTEWFYINDTAQIAFTPESEDYVFASAKNVASPFMLTSVIDINNPNYNDGVYTFPVGAFEYNITDVVFSPINTPYAISLPATVTNGSVTASKTNGIYYDESVTLTFTPDYGYEFISAQISYIISDKNFTDTINSSSSGYSAGSYTFTMPASNVTLSNVVFSTDLPTYTVSLPMSVTGGSVAADKLTGIVAGDQSTLTFTPNADYEFISAQISYLDGSTPVISMITPESSGYSAGSYTFTMPEADVTLSNVVFSTIQVTYTICLPIVLQAVAWQP